MRRLIFACDLAVYGYCRVSGGNRPNFLINLAQISYRDYVANHKAIGCVGLTISASTTSDSDRTCPPQFPCRQHGFYWSQALPALLF